MYTLFPTQMFPRLPARATFVADTNFMSGTQNVSDFVQKHFVSATNVSQFAQCKKHHGKQCVRNNVSSFTRASMHLSMSSPRGEGVGIGHRVGILTFSKKIIKIPIPGLK